jgi:DNA-binding transcriptional ArsR family regulator
MEVIYQSVKDIERLYKGLADENRLKIMYFLNELGEACVRDIQQVLRVPQPTVSRHLGLLKRMGLVDNHRRGKWNYYYVVKKQPDVVRNLLHCLTSLESCRKLFKHEMQPQMDKLLPRPRSRR